jgi:ElaA protein
MTASWFERAWAELDRDDLYAIMALRQRVFIVEQSCPYLDADGADAACRHLWAAGADGVMLAYLRIVPAGVKFAEPSLGRVITAPEARGTGLGKQLVAEGLARLARAYGPVPVRIGAQKYLERFYGDLGFVRSSDDYDEDGIVHLEMLRQPSQDGRSGVTPA